MEVVTFKAIALVSILAIGMVGGFSSVWLASSKKSDRVFSLGNAFAGGIFLGAGLIHMLPDAQDGFEGFAGKTGFPWVFLICAIGFLVVLFLEKVLLHAHDAIAQSEKQDPGRAFYPYALTLVLSVHSIVAGIALGTEQTTKLVLVILIAVAVHKGSAAFALGVSLFRGGIPKARTLKIICFFCFMTPLGIVIGSGMTAIMTGAAELLVTSVFDALAAGTFLYVASIDIVEHEFARPEARRLKFGLVLSGLAMMAGLAVWL